MLGVLPFVAGRLPWVMSVILAGVVTRSSIRYAETGGLQVAYQVTGDGRVDVLYVPGAINHIEAMWAVPEMARFAEPGPMFTVHPHG